ncbi:hypothetical protein CLHUN_17030 [Ruminiclostridium hungatei]|uniref:RiboL-PSP-HEPN domain-containing protein n=1 Tax=Ruminiclostridium hungatei TaxID=48256 RepID=A0A1V4SKR3_RUMHU|nr:hypothetical protein [Ruminiclostridium hungatei]OPX44404.1 hypothetical protein CLHUN_17030 [Ruminiclostridium hungatei]
MSNDAMTELKEIIREDIIDKVTRMMEQQETSFNLIDRNFQEQFSLTKKDMIVRILDGNPLRLLSQIVPYIKEKAYHEEVSLNIDSQDFREKFEFPFTECIQIEDFSAISKISSPEITVFHEEGIDVTHNLDIVIKIDRINYLSGEIYFKGKVSLTREVDDFILFDDFLDKFIEFTAYGLLKNENVPSWIEYLIEGCINVEYKNKKMALFNFFAAFDNFIELLNKTVFDYYVENYSYNIDLFKNSILEDMDGDVSEAEGYLKDKIKLFGRDTRKIIDEKLRDALKEMGIKGNNPKFEKMFTFISKIKDIEKIRNTIGHGSKVEIDIDIGNCLYYILTVIFSILFYEDIEANEWSNIIN